MDSTNLSVFTDYSTEYSSILAFSTIGVVLLSVIVVILPFSLQSTKIDLKKMIQKVDMQKDSYKIFAVFFLDTLSRHTLEVVIIAILYAFTSVSSLIGFIYIESPIVNIFTKGVCLFSSAIYAFLITSVTIYSLFKSMAIRAGFDWLRK